MEVQPIGELKAIYNPYTRHLLVRYGKVITEHTFEDQEEWTKASYHGDVNNPNYLHIQLDYDECMQLLFYPRVDGSDSLNEGLATCYNSGEEDNPDNVMIVHNCRQFDEALKNFLQASERELEKFKQIDY